MSALSLVRFEPKSPETQATDTNGDTSFFFKPVFWPFFYAREALEQGIRMERHALLDARNQIQLTIARRMFPGSSDFQSLCLFSEICRERFDHLTKQSPWLITWYRMGLQELVIQTTLMHICHHRKCHLCKSCHAI